MLAGITEQEDSIPIDSEQLQVEVDTEEILSVGDLEDNYRRSVLARETQPIIEWELTQLTKEVEQKTAEEIEKIKIQEAVSVCSDLGGRVLLWECCDSHEDNCCIQ